MKIIQKIGLALLVIGFLGLIVPGLEAATIKVKCDKGESVQLALDGLTGPTTIVVTGTCNENIDIFKDDVTIQGGTFMGPDPQQTTIYVEGARRVLIKGATVGGAGAGVAAFQGASLTLDNSVIAGNARQGVGVTRNSALILTNSAIMGNGGSGVNVSRSAYALIDGNTITGNFGNGVNIEGASATVTNNTIQGNQKKGIEVSSSGNARIGITEGDQGRGNIVENNVYEGINIANSAAAYMANNQIRLNGRTTGRAGVAINRSTGRLIGDNTIQGNGGHGVSVSLGTLFQGVGDFNLTPGPDFIAGNGYSGISGWNGASLDIRHVTVTNNTQNGIVLSLRSTLRIYDSTVSGNAWDGIRLNEGSAAVFQHPAGTQPAIITDNAGYGVFCGGQEASYSGDTSGVTRNGSKNVSPSCTGF